MGASIGGRVDIEAIAVNMDVLYINGGWVNAAAVQ